MPQSALRGVSETLYIPLLGRAEGERYGSILRDPMAREMVARLDYDFPRQSRFLSIYMCIRAAILDEAVREFLSQHPGAAVLHLGCGLDSRCLRVGQGAGLWVDVDLPPVIEARRPFFPENDTYRMLAASVTEPHWLDRLPDCDRVLVVAEGLTMYLTEEENRQLLRDLQQKFPQVEYIFDAYSCSAVRWSRRKNPVNAMGAVIRWGLDDPHQLEEAVPGVHHIRTQYFTGEKWRQKIASRGDQLLFALFYGNAWANQLYRIYTFSIRREDSDKGGPSHGQTIPKSLS